jgi:6,7-dimethyl-8-ribityllumazine synthase
MSSKSAPAPPAEPAPPSSRFAVVCARWNADVTDRLFDGALAALREAGVTEDRVTAVRVPGAFELPVVAGRLAKTGRYDAVICLGAVIKGDTDHDRYINDSVAHALQQVGLSTGVPALFGVLTCNDMSQALDRAGGRHGNKGAEAVAAAVELATLLRKLAGEGS